MSAAGDATPGTSVETFVTRRFRLVLGATALVLPECDVRADDGRLIGRTE